MLLSAWSIFVLSTKIFLYVIVRQLCFSNVDIWSKNLIGEEWASLIILLWCGECNIYILSGRMIPGFKIPRVKEVVAVSRWEESLWVTIMPFHMHGRVGIFYVIETYLKSVDNYLESYFVNILG